MQVLDQQIASPLAIIEERHNLGEGDGIDLPAFQLIWPAPPS
jgi:hypothetical protein